MRSGIDSISERRASLPDNSGSLVTINDCNRDDGKTDDSGCHSKDLTKIHAHLGVTLLAREGELVCEAEAEAVFLGVVICEMFPVVKPPHTFVRS
jgi:hypothetical protein